MRGWTQGTWGAAAAVAVGWFGQSPGLGLPALPEHDDPDGATPLLASPDTPASVLTPGKHVCTLVVDPPIEFRAISGEIRLEFSAEITDCVPHAYDSAFLHVSGLFFSGGQWNTAVVTQRTDRLGNGFQLSTSIPCVPATWKTHSAGNIIYHGMVSVNTIDSDSFFKDCRL